MAIIDDIREHLKTIPFQPFALRMADGREYPVPTLDHVYLPPKSGLVFVTNDKGVTVSLQALLIAGFVRSTSVV